MMKFFWSLKVIFISIIDKFKKKKVVCCSSCGEKWTVNKYGKTFVQITIYENVLSFQFNNDGDDDIDFCPECIKKGAIQCAWCGKYILFEQPVTLYTPSKKDFEVPKHAVIYSENPLRLVGCLRWDCAYTLADRAGFWVPSDDNLTKGKVQRAMSPIEQCLSQGGMVIVENASDPQESILCE